MALAVGENHKVLLMMTRAFTPSASDATAASGLGNVLSFGSQSKNSHSYLKLILCCILPSSCSYTKFHPHGTKNIDQLWLVGPVSQKIPVFISNLFYMNFDPRNLNKAS